MAENLKFQSVQDRDLIRHGISTVSHQSNQTCNLSETKQNFKKTLKKTARMILMACSTL
jgi:hypothetical protein